MFAAVNHNTMLQVFPCRCCKRPQALEVTQGWGGNDKGGAEYMQLVG